MSDTTANTNPRLEKRREELERELSDVQEQLNLAPSQVWNVILSIIMAAIGLTFIVLCDRHVISDTVVTIGGIAFILPGAALLLSLLSSRKGNKRGSVMSFITAICGVAAVALGVVILLMPEKFIGLLVYLFGAMIIVCAAWQFDVMMRRNRPTLYSGWLTMAPVLLVALGVVMCTVDIFKGETNEKWMLLATGIGFTLFGIFGLCISYFAVRNNHLVRKQQAEISRTADAPKEVSQSEGAAQPTPEEQQAD